MNTFDKISNLVNFSGSYINKKLGDGFEAVVQGIVSLDPEGASEAQLNSMRDDLKKASLKFATLSQDRVKEQRESDEAKIAYDKAKLVATLMNNKIKANPELSDQLMPKLELLITEAENKKAIFDKEALEAENVSKLVDMLEAIIDEKYRAIEMAQRALATAKVQMQTAEAKMQSNKLQDEIESMKSNKSSGLNVALQAMNKKTSQMEAEMAADQKIKSLSKSSDIMEDADVKALLETKVDSIDDRLSRL